MTGHLCLKGSKTSLFIIKSYFFKSLITPGIRFLHIFFQPLTPWRLSEAVSVLWYECYLTTIGDCWYFDRTSVPQRIKNQSLYNKIYVTQHSVHPTGPVLLTKTGPLRSDKTVTRLLCRRFSQNPIEQIHFFRDK